MRGCIAPPTSVEDERREREPLAPLPAAFAWERFATEERKVSWDGYLSYDGVLYGLPSEPPVAGSVVQVRERHGMLKVWSHGQLLVELAKRAGSGEHVEHPDQFRTVAPAASRRAQLVPLGHHRPAPRGPMNSSSRGPLPPRLKGVIVVRQSGA